MLCARTVVNIGPDVPPHVTIRPARPSAPSDVAHVASPTLIDHDIDTALVRPRPTVFPRHVLRRGEYPLSTFIRPERYRARSNLSSLDDVTQTYAPACLAICSAASATPPPIPWISTCSPACTIALVTTMRHAVSVASG